MNIMTDDRFHRLIVADRRGKWVFGTRAVVARGPDDRIDLSQLSDR